MRFIQPIFTLFLAPMSVGSTEIAFSQELFRSGAFRTKAFNEPTVSHLEGNVDAFVAVGKTKKQAYEQAKSGTRLFVPAYCKMHLYLNPNEFVAWRRAKP